MSCTCGDQPLRIRISKNGVVHAGSYKKYGGFTRVGLNRSKDEYIPVQNKIFTACYRNEWRDKHVKVDESMLVENTEKITCKNCMRAMGIIDPTNYESRFVVMKKDTKEYLKNSYHACNNWSENLYDAFMFKSEYAAKLRATMGRIKIDDNILNLQQFNEWRKTHKNDYSYEHIRIDDPNKVVLKVKLVIEE